MTSPRKIRMTPTASSRGRAESPRRPVSRRHGVVVVLALAALATGCARGDDRVAAEGQTPPPSIETTPVADRQVESPTTSSAASTSTTGPSTSTSTVPTSIVPTTTTTRPATTTTAPVAPTGPVDVSGLPALRPGAKGPAVALLQARLTELGYWVGTPDAAYGGLVEQAMFAFEKANGLRVDGVLSVADRDVLAGATRAAPRYTGGGRHVEIDKTRQLLLVVDGGRTLWAFNTSTGTELPYDHPTDGPQIADTPVGDWKISFEVDGEEPGDLGPLYRPKYFHSDGVAIHGAPFVPPAPASHGCARVTNAAMDLLWSDNLASKGTAVHVYGESPAPLT